MLKPVEGGECDYLWIRRRKDGGCDAGRGCRSVVRGVVIRDSGLARVRIISFGEAGERVVIKVLSRFAILVRGRCELATVVIVAEAHDVLNGV